MEMHLLSVGEKYYRTTPNNRYGRFDAPKEYALPMCSKCLITMTNNLMGLEIGFEAESYLVEMDHCLSCGQEELK